MCCWVRPVTRSRAGWWRPILRNRAGRRVTRHWRSSSSCLMDGLPERCACLRRRCCGWGHAGSASARGTTADWTWCPPWSWLAAFCTTCASLTETHLKRSGRWRWPRQRVPNPATNSFSLLAWTKVIMRKSGSSSVTILKSKIRKIIEHFFPCAIIPFVTLPAWLDYWNKNLNLLLFLYLPNFTYIYLIKNFIRLLNFLQTVLQREQYI